MLIYYTTIDITLISITYLLGFMTYCSIDKEKVIKNIKLIQYNIV